MNIQALIEMGRAAAKVIDTFTGTPYAGMAVKAGDAIINLIDGVKDTNAVTDPAELEETRAALEQRINAHADRVIDSLGDDPK